MIKLRKLIASAVSLVLACAAIPMVAMPASATTITFLQGDVDGNGQISLADMTMFTRYINGGLTISAEQLTRMDAVQNKVIEMQDYNKMLNCYFGMDTAQTVTSDVLTTINDETRTYCVYDYRAKQEIGTYTLISGNATSTYNMRSTAQYTEFIDTENINVVDINTGSGFIVDDNVIATAAHCVYSRETGSYKQNLAAIIYDCVVPNKLDSFEVAYVHVPQEFKTASSEDVVRKHDYALIYVEDNNEGEDLSQYGKWSLGCMTTEFASTGSDVTVSGYYGSMIFDTFNRHGSTGSILPSSTEYLFYTSAYTEYGQSGGPLYYETTYNNQTVKSVIGINTLAIYDNQDKIIGESGVKITPPLIQFFLNNPNIEEYISN